VNAFGTQFLQELVGVFLEASPYILLGFGVAALIQILLPVRLVQRLLGRGRARSIVGASLLGIPLPLCSCSVLPTALALRKRGAGRGATVSFLVSTPETGIDSIALTYGLMDPLMAIYRPFAALVSALTAGFATEAFGKSPQEVSTPSTADAGAAPADSDPGTPSVAHGSDALADAEARGAEPGLGITCMLGERYVFCTPMGGFLRLAGTLELSGRNHRMVGPRLRNLNESAAGYLEGMEGAESRDDWVGLRPVTPDGMPVVGRAPGLEGLYVANGHAMLGLTLGPVTGKLLSDLILGRELSRDITPLRPDRF